MKIVGVLRVRNRVERTERMHQLRSQIGCLDKGTGGGGGRYSIYCSS